jgi:two-component system response regulator YesN
MEYIKSYRLLKAKALLLETDRKIGDIACSVGFYDLHHFSKVFREQEGLSPAQYRQMKL